MAKAAQKKTTSKKKTTRTTSHKTSGPTPGSYTHQRDAFFETHPNSRPLLVVLVLAIAVYIGAMLWGQITLYNAEVANPGLVEASF